MRFNLIKYLILFFILTNSKLIAQLTFEYSSSIDVSRNGELLKNPWAGGLNYPQFSSIDYDFDGNLDLFIFDRSSDNIRVFRQEETNGVKNWNFIHDANKKFPTNIIYRATLVDYDNDGKLDLFTYSIGGLKVYKNTGDFSTGLQWELFQPIVFSDYNGFRSNLFIASSDIPAIIDVDFDGDIDILTFHQGGQHLEYHKNMSMENYGIPDSLEFVLTNECWGKFSEDEVGNTVILNDPNSPCIGGNLTNPESIKNNSNNTEKDEGSRHSGSTILALDYDNSGVLDLILGDVSYDNLLLLINGGTSPNTNSAMISVETNFPSNTTQALISSFPAPYYLDVDFDGVKDLIVATNAKHISQNEKSVLFYHNSGTDNNPTFNYVTNSFLQNQMIEHGKGSIPVIYDVNNDGLDDLLISNLYRYENNTTRSSSIAYYQNTGTASQPEFTFIDSNWLNLSSLNYGLRLVPTFGDINGDGTKELILGREDGTLILYENNGTNFINPTINLRDNNNDVIQVGGSSYPQLFDLNEDGLLDLVIGNRNGTLHYYQNIGTFNSPSFQLINNKLGNIQITDFNFPESYASPHFFKLNDTTHLFLGASDGKIHYYTEITNNLSPGNAFNLISSSFLDINVDANSTFFVKDINDNNLLNLFVGQDLGGLFHYEVNPNSHLSLEKIITPPTYNIFPNPTKNTISIQSSSNESSNIKLLTLEGNILIETTISNETTIDLNKLATGIYLLLITDKENNKSTHRIIKQ